MLQWINTAVGKAMGRQAQLTEILGRVAASALLGMLCLTMPTTVFSGTREVKKRLDELAKTEPLIAIGRQANKEIRSHSRVIFPGWQYESLLETSGYLRYHTFTEMPLSQLDDPLRRWVPIDQYVTPYRDECARRGGIWHWEGHTDFRLEDTRNVAVGLSMSYPLGERGVDTAIWCTTSDGHFAEFGVIPYRGKYRGPVGSRPWTERRFHSFSDGGYNLETAIDVLMPLSNAADDRSRFAYVARMELGHLSPSERAGQRQLQALREQADRATRKADDDARVGRAKEIQKAFDASLTEGANSHCGLVVELKPTLAYVQTASGLIWMKREQLYPKSYVPCVIVGTKYYEPSPRDFP
jgi:hypothetical protein